MRCVYYNTQEKKLSASDCIVGEQIYFPPEFNIFLDKGNDLYLTVSENIYKT